MNLRNFLHGPISYNRMRTRTCTGMPCAPVGSITLLRVGSIDEVRGDAHGVPLSVYDFARGEVVSLTVFGFRVLFIVVIFAHFQRRSPGCI